MNRLETIKTKIREQEKFHEELVKEFNKRKRKFDEIEQRITQPRGNELVLRAALKAKDLDP